MIPRLKADSLPDYVRTVTEVRARWIGKGDWFDPWFRGHRKAAWGLEPSLYRLGFEREEEQGEEEELRAEFERRGLQLRLGPPPKDPWEWYFLMQHHRCPTRLLDWTDSALVGLFFAVNSNDPVDRRVGHNAAVWMLDPWWLNRQVLRLDSVVFPGWKEAAPYLPNLYGGHSLRCRLPIAIDPPHVAARIAVQRSRFTIHGTAHDGLERVARRAKAKNRLVCIEIARSSLPSIRRDLITCGVTDSTVFPELEGLSRELTRYALTEVGN